LSSFSNAQKVEKFIAKAEEAYENADYYAAADYYQMGIEKYPENVALKYGLAESLRKYNDYDRAAKSYKDVVTDDAQKKYPLSGLLVCCNASPARKVRYGIETI
jgi:thioredoxin-like negative regulator of GroEL